MCRCQMLHTYCTNIVLVLQPSCMPVAKVCKKALLPIHLAFPNGWVPALETPYDQ